MAEAPQTPKLSTHFATPFLTLKHPAHERLNPRLLAYFKTLEQQGERNPNQTPSHQVAIFESDFDLFKRDHPAIKTLALFCEQAIWYCVRQMNGYSEQECRKMELTIDSWFHITETGGYISNHNHPNASWSAVYMVDPGDLDDDTPDSGQISFKDPRPHANMYLDEGNYKMRYPFSIGSVNFRMLAGDLMLFPSWLVHEVKPYTGKRPRVTVALNCAVEYRHLKR